jgi:hypothetical protein
MIEDMLDIETKDGGMETFVCRPERRWERLVALYRRGLG